MADVREDSRYVSLVPETCSELVIPLVHKDRVVGVFDLESPELGRFTERPALRQRETLTFTYPLVQQHWKP